jgi:hypothetical protein
VGEKEREKREAMIGGLNSTGSALDQTLSEPVRTMSRLDGLCLDGTLCPGRSSRLGFFF